MRVMDNKLFSVEPKKGRLDPGCHQTVTFTYTHIMAGTDRLPVLLKLDRGREILVYSLLTHVAEGHESMELLWCQSVQLSV